ncbi:hypothetical protein TNCV_2656311 [Trichonephila clavipes]|nr:hypothetical protein TNCV_2656311 [Trichonephila clavipes]
MVYGEGPGPVEPPPFVYHRYWVTATPEKLEVACTLEKSAHPWNKEQSEKSHGLWRRARTCGASPPPFVYHRYWADRNTLKKLGVARTLEKSAHP